MTDEEKKTEEGKRVFEAAVAALKVGAPGLSESTRNGIAQNICLRLHASRRSA